jgi:pRiA4b ORF-3-like protein
MPKYFEFDVTLRDVEPRIWRRFLIREGAFFHELHEAIQDACGWENCHLYAFRDPKTRKTVATIPSDDGFGKPEPDAERVRVRTCFVPTTKTGCLYEYDFGDRWLHDVVLRQIVELPETFKRRLLDGAGAFPPEDCGSLPGYEDCVRVANGEKVQDREDLEEWLGDWKPERFDLEETKREFDR